MSLAVNLASNFEAVILAQQNKSCMRVDLEKGSDPEMSRTQVPRLARNIHFSAVQGRKVNVSCGPEMSRTRVRKNVTRAREVKKEREHNERVKET